MDIEKLSKKLMNKVFMYEVSKTLRVKCHIRGVKASYGRVRILLEPDSGRGESWINLPDTYKDNVV